MKEICLLKEQRRQFLRETIKELSAQNDEFHLEYTPWELVRMTFIRYRYMQKQVNTEFTSKDSHREDVLKHQRRVR